MRVWLRRHPVLGVFMLVLFGLIIAMAMAAIASTNQTITPSDTRRKPTIAGASPSISGMAGVAITPSQAVDDGKQVGRLQLLLMQAIFIVVASAVSVYLTLMVTGNI